MTVSEIKNKVQRMEAEIIKATERVVTKVQKMPVAANDMRIMHNAPFTATVNMTAVAKTNSLSAETYNIEAQRNEVIAILRGCSFDSAMKQMEALIRTGTMPRSGVKAHPEFVKALKQVLHGRKESLK